jgi:hypothetical protein
MVPEFGIPGKKIRSYTWPSISIDFTTGYSNSYPTSIVEDVADE